MPFWLVFIAAWPVIRRLVYLMPPETAHHAVFPMLIVFDRVERAWQWLVLVFTIGVILLIKLLTYIPGFRFTPPSPNGDGT